jgi:hypothetical protein
VGFEDEERLQLGIVNGSDYYESSSVVLEIHVGDIEKERHETRPGDIYPLH